MDAAELVPEEKVLEGVVVRLALQAEPNPDWAVINRAFANTVWTIEGGIVERETGVGDSEQQGNGLIA